MRILISAALDNIHHYPPDDASQGPDEGRSHNSVIKLPISDCDPNSVLQAGLNVKKRKLSDEGDHDRDCSWKEKALATEEARLKVATKLNTLQRKVQPKDQELADAKLTADDTVRACEVTIRRYRDDNQVLVAKYNRDIKAMKAK